MIFRQQKLDKPFHGCDEQSLPLALKKWFESDVGQQFIGSEKQQIDDVLPNLFGFYLLQVGHLGEIDLLSSSRVSHCLVVGAQTEPLAAFHAESWSLPVKSDSIDVVILPHTLDFARFPHEVLREVERVLIPEGHVVITGFNPLSLIGLRRMYARVVNDSLSSHRLINPIRLFDWLTLLGYELEGKPLYSGYALPFKRLMRKFDLPILERRVTSAESGLTAPFGSLLVVNAVKQAVSARPHWRGKKDRRRLAPVAYPRVASWQRIKP